MGGFISLRLSIETFWISMGYGGSNGIYNNVHNSKSFDPIKLMIIIFHDGLNVSNFVLK